MSGGPRRPSIDAVPAEAQPFEQDSSRRLAHYILVRAVGSGGTGTVWKAWDLRLTRWVAVKMLHAEDGELLARFAREAQLAGRLRHPNIATVFEVGELPAALPGSTARHYLVMEFIEGRSLAAARLPLRDAVEVFARIARAVDAAHRMGVIHRDLKPQNVMLTPDGWPYLMDFGLAKAQAVESSLSGTGQIMGTPAFMSPEQAKGALEEVGARSDVYSLGATMYFVLTRRRPVEGRSLMEVLLKICQEDPVPPRVHEPSIPEEIDRIVRRAMMRDPSARFGSAAELAEDLERWLAAVPAPLPPPPSRPRRPRVSISSLVVASVIGAAALAAIALRPATESRPAYPPAPPRLDPGERWAQEWSALRDAWDPDHPAVSAGRMNRQLLRMGSEARGGDAVAAADWFGEQAHRAADSLLQAKRQSGPPRREAALRVVRWCDAAREAARGVEGLRPVSEHLASVSAEATAVATIAPTRRTFSLMLAVRPFAEVKRVTRNGVDLALPVRSTPLVAQDLEIGDYELVLVHPFYGERRVVLPASRIPEGRTCTVSGRMQDAALKVGDLP